MSYVKPSKYPTVKEIQAFPRMFQCINCARVFELSHCVEDKKAQEAIFSFDKVRSAFKKYISTQFASSRSILAKTLLIKTMFSHSLSARVLSQKFCSFRCLKRFLRRSEELSSINYGFPSGITSTNKLGESYSFNSQEDGMRSNIYTEEFSVLPNEVKSVLMKQEQEEVGE